MTATTDLVSAIAVDRERWERSLLDPVARADIETEVSELLRIKAQQAAATRGRRVSELRQVEARNAEQVDELELMGAEVQARPERYVVVRARWSTSEISPDSDGIRRVTIPIPFPGRPRAGH